jgi:hypothetical protein
MERIQPDRNVKFPFMRIDRNMKVYQFFVRISEYTVASFARPLPYEMHTNNAI